MDGAELFVALVGLLLLAGIALDVILRPLPALASRRRKARRHAFWGVLVLGYLSVLLVL